MEFGVYPRQRPPWDLGQVGDDDFETPACPAMIVDEQSRDVGCWRTVVTEDQGTGIVHEGAPWRQGWRTPFAAFGLNT